MALILAFASKLLREVCEDEKKAEQRFGKKVTERLKHRLADLEATIAKSNRAIFVETRRRILCRICREPCEEPP